MYIKVVNRLLLWAQDLLGAASLDEKQLKSKRQRGSEELLKDTKASAEWFSTASSQVCCSPATTTWMDSLFQT